MQTVHLKDCHFHDSVIQKITFDGTQLTLCIPESFYENTYEKTKVEIEVLDVLNIIEIKQYYRFGRVRYRGEKISILELQELFRQGYDLRIDELFLSCDSAVAIFDCAVIPCPKGRGRSRTVRLELHNYRNVVFKGIDEL